MDKARNIRIKFGEKVAIAAFAGALSGMLAANAANQLNAPAIDKQMVEQSNMQIEPIANELNTAVQGSDTDEASQQTRIASRDE